MGRNSNAPVKAEVILTVSLQNCWQVSNETKQYMHSVTKQNMPSVTKAKQKQNKNKTWVQKGDKAESDMEEPHVDIWIWKKKNRTLTGRLIIISTTFGQFFF